MYPVAASDGATIVVCGHSQGLSLLKIYKNHTDCNESDVDSHGSVKRGVERWLDIELTHQVLRLACPPPSTARATNVILQNNLFVVVGSSDSSIILVSVPLSQVADSVRRGRTASIRTIRVDEVDSHHDLLSALAITSITGKHDAAEHSLLVASISATGTGLLMVHRLSLKEYLKGQLSASVLIARKYLQMPLVKCSLEFSPSTSNTLLVSAQASGVVKIFKIEHDADSSVTTGTLLQLITLHAPRDTEASVPRHDHILDAKWCRRGKSIIVLLDSCEWGVFDIDGSNKIKATTNCYSRKRGQLRRPDKFSYGGSMSDVARMTQRSSPFCGTSNDRETPAYGSSQTYFSRPTCGTIARCPLYSRRADEDVSFILSCGNTSGFLASLRSFQSAAGKVQTLSRVQFASEHQLMVSKLNISDPGDTALWTSAQSASDLLFVTSGRIILLNKLLPQLHPRENVVDLSMESTTSAKKLLKRPVQTTIPVSVNTSASHLSKTDMQIHVDNALAETRKLHDSQLNDLSRCEHLQPRVDSYDSTVSPTLGDAYYMSGGLG